MKKKTYKEALLQFQQQGRNDILLLEEGYECWRKKAKFLDLVINEIFFAIPKSVFYQRSCHPDRAKQNRKQTNLKKYGNVSSLHGSTNEALKVKNKKEETWKKKYGVEHFSKSNVVQEKVKKTNLSRYGVENQGQLKKIRVENSLLSVEDWFIAQPEPKPSSYQSFGTLFLFGKQRIEYSTNELEDFLKKYKEHKTLLEKRGEELFQMSHFNQKAHPNLKYRPDFQFNSNLFLNLDGLFWHSNKNKDRKYHFQLREEFEKSQLRIVQFREDEIYEKPKIVLSMMENLCGKNACKIYARKTKIEKVSQKDANLFLTENHLMGSIKAKHIGLFDNNKLVCLLSYKQRKNVLVIERFASSINCVVVGGLSKLIKWCKANIPTSKIQSWVDLRYATGQSLTGLGFKEIKTTLGWKWTDGNKTYNRLQCRANMDDRKLSEKEYAEELGWYKIYDAGQRLFELTL